MKITEPIREFTFYAAGDNYEPSRSLIVGVAAAYPSTSDPTQETLVLFDALTKFKAPTNAVYLIDDGDKVESWYVAGWQPAAWSEFKDCVFLQRFPLSQGVRPDNGQPVDMSRWMLGPRVAYHLKVDKGYLSPPCQTHSMAGVRRG
jgi:hypothetical protein